MEIRTVGLLVIGSDMQGDVAIEVTDFPAFFLLPRVGHYQVVGRLIGGAEVVLYESGYETDCRELYLALVAAKEEQCRPPVMLAPVPSLGDFYGTPPGLRTTSGYVEDDGRPMTTDDHKEYLEKVEHERQARRGLAVPGMAGAAIVGFPRLAPAGEPVTTDMLKELTDSQKTEQQLANEIGQSFRKDYAGETHGEPPTFQGTILPLNTGRVDAGTELAPNSMMVAPDFAAAMAAPDPDAALKKSQEEILSAPNKVSFEDEDIAF